MAKQNTVKQDTFATSTIQITKLDKYEKLEKHYKLVRYLIPEAFRGKQQSDRYKLLYVELREQLLVPHRTYDYDGLDGAERYVIYALYPRHADVAPLTLSFLSDDPLDQREIAFHEISTFNLVKLLQADYFNAYPYFASMGNYFVHAKPSGKDWHLCLAIFIHGADKNVGEDRVEKTQQEFWVTGQAKYFNKPFEHPNEYSKRRFPYYKLHMSVEHVVFEQLPYDQIDAYKGEVFQQFTKQSKPARLPYHAQNAAKVLPSRGYLIHQFTTQFVEKLQRLGIPAQIKERTWTQFTPSKHAKSLPQQLDQIYLFDNRQNQTTHPIQEYQKCLAEHYTAYQFLVIHSLDEAQHQPVLILQDTHQEDYEEGGLFFGHEDPYKTIYRKYQDIPKQSINVNEYSGTTFKGNRNEYLNYQMIPLAELAEDEDDEESETGWAIQFQVSFYQLYLKHVVMNRKPVSQYLPISGNLKQLMSYIYIRKQTFRGTSYHIAVRVVDDQLEFHDLRDPTQKSILSEVTMIWGYDWQDIEDVLYAKYHKKKDGGKEVKDYDLILTPQRAVELETVDETVIYKYAEIERRLGIRSAKQPIEELYLLPHYDTLRSPKTTVSRADLKGVGLLDGREPDGEREVASMDFWRKLNDYDHLLEEVRDIQSRITYDDFVNMRRNDIGKIFKFPLVKKGDQYVYNTNKLLDYYKTIWNIGGFKSDDVQMSKGIWYDLTDFAYTVGDVIGFKDAQDRANLVRRFDVLYGEKRGFNIQEFLEATGVQFIRYRQYTVFPYPFYLIEKYIQDVLFHQ